MLDPVAEHLLALLVGLDDELTARLAAVEAEAVTLSGGMDGMAVTQSIDHDEAMLTRIRVVAANGRALRLAKKRNLQRLRRAIAAYRQDLGIDPPASTARPPMVVDAGRRRVAIQTSGEDDIRRIEGQHEPPDTPNG